MITPFPETLIVGDSSIEQFTEESWDTIKDDPRGILLMWERPKKNAKYVMGLDPSQGITGWSRATKADGDTKTDNGAIEIFEIDGHVELAFKVEDGQKIPDMDQKTGRQRRIYKDVQVAEFAAPCDAVEIARVANVLGRIYAGEEEDQCLLVHEAWPGPGILTTQELLRLGYSNLWTWQFIDSVVEDTNRIGWRSTRESQKLLWFRSRRHLMQRSAVIKSRFLLDELSNAEIDVDKMRARAAYGWHDDRMQASNMAFWAGHAWVYNVERTEVRVSESAETDYQRYAPGLDDYISYKDWKSNATDDWEI